MFARLGQALYQCFAVWNNNADMSAHQLRLSSGQMKLAAPDVDPHINGAGHQERIARQPEAGHIENRRDLLIGNGYIDMFEGDYIAEIFGGTVELTLHKASNL